MTIKLKISTKTLTIGDVIRAEEGFANNRQIVEFLARFVVDDDGAPVSPDEALNLIMSLPVSELPDLVSQFQAAIGVAQDSAVPLATSDA